MLRVNPGTQYVPVCSADFQRFQPCLVKISNDINNISTAIDAIAQFPRVLQLIGELIKGKVPVPFRGLRRFSRNGPCLKISRLHPASCCISLLLDIFQIMTLTFLVSSLKWGCFMSLHHSHIALASCFRNPSSERAASLPKTWLGDAPRKIRKCSKSHPSNKQRFRKG